MKLHLNILLFLTISIAPGAFSQTTLASGEQPQIAVDDDGVVRLVFGENDNILYSTSRDNGKTFSRPVIISKVEGMHLGMTRGPQLATSRDYSAVTAIDKMGNIHSFRLNHKSNKWKKLKNVNDLEGSAPEGLMGIAADEKNNFFAVWLDVREKGRNNVCFSRLEGGSEWSQNEFAYLSPESNVCECCKPSIAVKGNNVYVMFRNLLKGSRDLYLTMSADKGETFTAAQRLGNGTWQLKGCPMDGGGLSIDSEDNIHTAWQRDGLIFHALSGQAEEKIGQGRGVGMSGSLVTWGEGTNVVIRRPGGEKKHVGEGTALRVYEFRDHRILAVWEREGQIVFKKIEL